MLLSKTISLATAVFAISTQAVETNKQRSAVREAPIPGYGVVDIGWEFEVSPGIKVSYNGTVQEVVAKASKDHPTSHFVTSWKANLAKIEARDEETSPANTFTQDLFKRDTVLCCNFGSGYQGACENEVREGITYLRGVGGRPTNGPGPGNCGRVSCGWKAAIWWCNDAHESKTLPSFNNIADGAQVIMNNCIAPAKKGSCGYCVQTTASVSGQDFHADNWNVIVRRNEC